MKIPMVVRHVAGVEECAAGRCAVQFDLGGESRYLGVLALTAR